MEDLTALAVDPDQDEIGHMSAAAARLFAEQRLHRWSGYPGAWCLDCGIEDPREVCLAEGHDIDCNLPGCRSVERCPEPGSGRHDPYGPPPIRALVCGSRHWTDRAAIAAIVCSLPKGSTVIVGGARGADETAELEARRQGYDVEVYRAEWRTHGGAAGPIRNTRMLHEGKPTHVYAFPLAASRGTRDMMQKAAAAGVPVIDVSRLTRGR
jgi:hypothetical protein